MAKLYGWAKDFHDEYKNDPEYITTGIVIEIIDNLAAKMEEEGISKAEFARRLGKGRAYVTKLLRGYYDNLTIKTLVELALALGKRPEKFNDLLDLFGDKKVSLFSIFKTGSNFLELPEYPFRPKKRSDKSPDLKNSDIEGGYEFSEAA